MYIIELAFKKLKVFPLFLYYILYDLFCYIYFRKYLLFNGWGIHLFTGRFGKGKTSLMTIKAYKLCEKYPQLHILTNLQLTNYPEHTKIIPLKTARDILNAPNNTIVLIDEIGTLFNSRDFSGGKNSVPKPLFQHLCQCRKRHMMIYATVQRFNLLDKQIRDITATVTECSTSFSHPFSRMLTGLTYDIDEYEAYCNNPLYVPKVLNTIVEIQLDKFRHLYDTTELIKGFENMTYLSDEEILRNQGSYDTFSDGSKEGQKAFKKAVKRRR